MATTTRIPLGGIGKYNAFIDVVASPGTDGVEIETDSTYVVAAIAGCSTTANKAVICTPRTSDHTTAALGSYCLEPEADVTCYVFLVTVD